MGCTSELIYFLKVQEVLKPLIFWNHLILLSHFLVVLSSPPSAHAKLTSDTTKRASSRPRGRAEMQHRMESASQYASSLNPLIIAGYSAGPKDFPSNTWNKTGIPSSLSTPLLEEVSFQFNWAMCVTVKNRFSDLKWLKLCVCLL